MCHVDFVVGEVLEYVPLKQQFICITSTIQFGLESMGWSGVKTC